MASIAFPAIGTGNLGYPKDLVASSMLDEILAFSSKKKPVHLKEIVIMLFPGDPQTMQVKPEHTVFVSHPYGVNVMTLLHESHVDSA